MRVLLDVTSAAKPRPTGIANYARALVGALLALRTPHEWRTGTRPGRWRTRRHARDLRGSDGRPPRLLLGPGYAFGAGRPDLLHALGVRLPRHGRYAKVVTIHDLGTIDRPDLTPADWSRRRARRIAESVARADGVVTPSAFTRGRLLAAFPDLDPRRVAVVPHGVDAARFAPPAPAAAAATARALGLARPFVLHVSAYAPRKNQALLVRAFARSGLAREGDLVFCGPRGAGAEALAAVARDAGVAPAVRFLGYLPLEQVPLLLGAARCFVVPSRYEGFGLPLLEALACGTPALAARASCLPEVGGDAALWFDPDDEEGLAALLAGLWPDAARRAALGRAGRAQAAGFTWERTARETLAFYAQVLARRPTRPPAR